MAEFCNRCSDRIGIPHVYINVKEIFDSLDKGNFRNVLCEGCALGGIGKTEDNNLILASVRDGEWMSEEEFYNN